MEENAVEVINISKKFKIEKRKGIFETNFDVENCKI